jgi:hypothetical protein
MKKLALILLLGTLVTGLTVSCRKRCGGKKDCICTMEYNPVCANGVTYGNECLAKCEGITNFTSGECK